MTLAVLPIPIAARLVDTESALDLAKLRGLRDEKVDGIIAYLGGNLTPQLIADATSLDMGIVPVNFSHGAGWIPSAPLGEADAASSVRRLVALGVPLLGLDDWCDIEGCGGDPTEYCKAWCARVAGDGAGRVPGEYIGEGSRLGGHEHYLLPFRGYWHSCSVGIPEPDCGFKLDQLFPPNQTCAGVVVDFTFARRDFHGRAPTWLKAGG